LLNARDDMNTPTRVSIFAALSLLGTGCDAFFDTERQLQEMPPVTSHDASSAQDASADVPPCRAVTPDPAIDYERMCRNYCDALEDTTRYFLLARGEAPADAGDLSQSCYELRCVPKCVDQALCFTQCETAATHYAVVCGNAPDAGSDPVCPSSVEDHTAACRTGCSPPAPPPPLEP
jgi:hypothetical protein